MVGLAASPIINVLLQLLMKPKINYRRLPNTRATALFSYCDISVGHAACLTTKRAGRESSLVALIVLRKGIRLKQNALPQLCLPRGFRAAPAASIKLES